MSAPQTVSLIPPQSHAPSASVSLDIKPYFFDLDATDVLTFSATGFPASTGLSISSSTGAITGTPTSQDLAASYNLTVTATDSHSHTAQIVIPFVTATAPSAAQNFYVNNETGNDAWDGLSATFTSGTNGPWRSIARANTVVPHGSGHVDINVAKTNTPYRNDCWTPANAGTDATHKIRLKPTGSGEILLRGPAVGSSLQALDMRVQWTEVLRDGATAWFSVDGEVSFGTGGGQVAKGDNPQLVQHLGQGVFVGADNVTIDCNIFRTCGGWTAVGQLSDIDNFVCRANCDQHGTPYCPPGVDGISTVQDYGDFFFIPQDTPQGNKFLFDGGTTGRAMNRGGHAVCVIYGGTGTMRGYKSTGDWGTVPTFVPANWGSLLSGDGNRTFQFGGRAALDWHMYNCVLERNGQPVDQPRVEITKIEGTRTSIHDCILRLSDHNGFEISSANWSWNSRGLRVSHCVVEHLKGLLVSMRDYGDGHNPPFDIRLYNLIVRNVSTAAEAGLTDTLLDINLLSGTWTDVIYMHGITVQDATRDFDDLKIGIYGAGAPGLQTVNYYLTNHAANFANWTVTTDANLDNAPTMTQDADLLDIPGEYLPVSDSISVNQGSHLTTATSAGASSTSLAVADGTWFPDPVYGNPGFGYFSSGFQVHLGGVGNVTYTAISRSAWPSKAATLTLSAAQTWSNGANVNLPISSGTVPNRGVR